MGKTLLTFTGFHDPYSPGLVEGESHPGPILTLVQTKGFSRVVLISTPNTDKITTATIAAIQERAPKTVVERRLLPIKDPTNYAEIFAGVKEVFTTLEKTKSDEFFIGISSGTPQMHACWLLLAASGEIPARILMTRPPQFVTKDAPLVQEVNFTANSFPLIRSKPAIVPQPSTQSDLGVVLREMNIVADEPKIQIALAIAATVAQTDLPILILGETGTGKEVVARLIDRLSGRDGAFISVNCAAIPKDLAESQLFGHVKGSFSGAIRDQQGEFEKANSGTLFLDELGELSLDVQAKLLRAIQEQQIQPLGAAKPKKIKVRFIAATNTDIAAAVEKGAFREDLYHRLNTGEILLPPLRERAADIPKLALNILDATNKQQRKQRRLTQEALVRLQKHSWPGNIRELQNVIERTVLLSPDEVVGPEHLLIKENSRSKDPFRALPSPQEGFVMDDFIGKVRKHFFLRALETANGNQSEAARLLGVSPQAVHKFIKTNEEGE